MFSLILSDLTLYIGIFCRIIMIKDIFKNQVYERVLLYKGGGDIRLIQREDRIKKNIPSDKICPEYLVKWERKKDKIWNRKK